MYERYVMNECELNLFIGCVLRLLQIVPQCDKSDLRG